MENLVIKIDLTINLIGFTHDRIIYMHDMSLMNFIHSRNMRSTF